MFKKLFLAMAAVGITAMPFAATAATSVALESQLKVRNNSTQGQFVDSVNLTDDQVVDIQVWYHNREEADSGKIAKNVKVKVSLPTGAGKVQKVNSTVSADNANTSTDTATINLPLDDARLEFIPGSGVWRHNAGTNQNVNYVNTKLSSAQEQALLGGGLVVEDAKPCFNFEATLTIQARVKAGAVTLQKQVKVDGDASAKYATSNTAKAGQTLSYVLIVKNMGNTTLDQVQVADRLPAGLTYVPGSTRLVNSITGSAGKTLSDEKLTQGGITIDDMAPASTQYVYFKAKVSDNLPCGNNQLKNLGFVKAKGLEEIYNQAITTVTKQCAPTPETPQNPSLPETGAETALAGIAGTGVLGYTVNAYRKSKRSVVDALKNITK